MEMDASTSGFSTSEESSADDETIKRASIKKQRSRSQSNATAVLSVAERKRLEGRAVEAAHNRPNPDAPPGTECDSSTHQQRARRKISTKKDLRKYVTIKEGYLLKQGKSFQRWKRRFFKLKGRSLYYGSDPEAVIFQEISIAEASIAEVGGSGAPRAFHLITPFHHLRLAADSRREMDDWISALTAVAHKQFYEADSEQMRSARSGEHTWYVCSHARPTYCNCCREALSGMTWHGLSCEVCKAKAHKRCASKIHDGCKWTTLESIPASCRLPSPAADPTAALLSPMPHQWLEGNVGMSAKCAVCERTAGSILRLQDWRCLWCQVVLHDGHCRDSYPRRCPMGANRLSVLPPVGLESLAENGVAVHEGPKSGSPLLVLVNSKSGDNQGIKVIRRFKRLLNPAQVYDLMTGGPEFGLRLMSGLDSFRVLVCGGDGSVGWVFAAMDRLGMRTQCQVGVMPLGTGNDMARVLGWGTGGLDPSAASTTSSLPALIERLERAHTQMIDRWSILVYEGPDRQTVPTAAEAARASRMADYEASVGRHLGLILSSEDHGTVISSSKILCEVVRDFLSGIRTADASVWVGGDEGIAEKCVVLETKLDNLVGWLERETAAVAAEESRAAEPDGEDSDEEDPHFGHLQRRRFVQREALMARADSLKKAVKEIIEHAERAVDEQTELINSSALAQPSAARPQGRKSKTRRWPLRKKQRESEGSLNSPLPQSPHSLQFPMLRDEPSSSISVDEGTTEAEESGSRPSSTQPQRQAVRAQVSAPLQANPTDPSDSTVPDDPANVPTCSKSFTPPHQMDTPGQKRGLRTTATAPGRFVIGEGSGEVLDAPPELPVLPSLPEPIVSAAIKRGAFKSSFSDTSLRELESGSFGASHRRATTQRLVRQRTGPSMSAALREGLLAPGIASGSLIAEVLLLNASVLGVAASPLIDATDVPLDWYREASAMNNYFSIGLDAKIALEFHQKREERPDKARSRSKLYMWYGMLGAKEVLAKTYRNLEQSLSLECDGVPVRLPSLQGIVVLNIPSYQGGANFWGNTAEDDKLFSPQSMEDGRLEVVAVFGVIHCATSRVLRLQNHRIAQCRTVRVRISGPEPIPVQVDGEPWVQPPATILIKHKHRAQVLVRNREFERTLRSWADSGLGGRSASVSLRSAGPLLRMYSASEAEALISFLHSSADFVALLQGAVEESRELERRIGETLAQASFILKRLHPPNKKLQELTHLHYHLSDAVGAIKALVHQISSFSLTPQASTTNLEAESSSSSAGRERLESGVWIGVGAEKKAAVEESWRRVLLELRRAGALIAGPGPSAGSLVSFADSATGAGSSPDAGSRFSGDGVGSGAFRPKAKTLTQWLRATASKIRRKESLRSTPSTSGDCRAWTVEEVGSWLGELGLGEHRAAFVEHKVDGYALVRLERKDMRELGLSRIGDLKRLQGGLADLHRTLTKTSSDPHSTA